MSKTEARISLAVDAMGGDQGPQEVLAGVAKAVSVSPRNTLIHAIWPARYIT